MNDKPGDRMTLGEYQERARATFDTCIAEIGAAMDRMQDGLRQVQQDAQELEARCPETLAAVASAEVARYEQLLIQRVGG